MNVCEDHDKTYVKALSRLSHTRVLPSRCVNSLIKKTKTLVAFQSLRSEKSLFYFTEKGITHIAETRRLKSTFMFNLAFDEDRKTHDNIFVILHLDMVPSKYV